MTHATASKLFSSLIAILVLTCAPNFVFAQHGGGGHGGGGGGFHGGGGSRGGFSGASRSSGGGGSYHAAPGPAGAGPYSRPGGNSYRPPNGNADRAPTGNTATAYGYSGRGPTSNGANGMTQAQRDGQWHSFGQPRSPAPATAGNSGGGAGNSFAASASRVAPSTGTATTGAATRSFAGQGREIYEETSRGRASGLAAAQPYAAASSNIVASRMSQFQFGGSAVAGSRGVGTSSVLASRPFATASTTTFGRLGTLGAVGTFPVVRSGFGGFGFGFRTFPPFRSPFFGFGFGGGFGWGFGYSPCWGFGWGWDPFCDSSLAPFSPYGNGYPGFYPYAYPPSIGYDPNYDPNYNSGDSDYNPPPASSSSEQPSASSGPQNPNDYADVNAPIAGNPENLPGSVIIYLKDGTSLSPSDYWLTNGQLHYVLGGSENTIDLDRVDLPRSNEENQRRGVRFLLKSAPDANPAPEQNDNTAPDPAAAPQSAPDSQPTPTLKLSTQGTA